MKRYSSRAYKSKEPRVKFAVQEEDCDSHVIQENVPQNYDFSNDSQKQKKSTTTSLASKFSKRWEHLLTDSSSRQIKQYEEPVPITRDIENSEDFGPSISPNIHNYDDVSNEENYEDNFSDDKQNVLLANRNPTNQNAEALLQSIEALVNRVHEICNKK